MPRYNSWITSPNGPMVGMVLAQVSSTIFYFRNDTVGMALSEAFWVLFLLAYIFNLVVPDNE